MGDVFWRHLFARVAYLQGERQPLLGPNDVELLRTKVTITVYSLQALYTERMGDVFWRHLFVRVAYLQG